MRAADSVTSKSPRSVFVRYLPDLSASVAECSSQYPAEGIVGRAAQRLAPRILRTGSAGCLFVSKAASTSFWLEVVGGAPGEPLLSARDRPSPVERLVSGPMAVGYQLNVCWSYNLLCLVHRRSCSKILLLYCASYQVFCGEVTLWPSRKRLGSGKRLPTTVRGLTKPHR